MDQRMDPLAWLVGLLGTVTLGWVGAMSRKTSEHSVKIAKLETHYDHIKEGIDEIKDHLGVPRKES
jgi:hypothetical protein